MTQEADPKLDGLRAEYDRHSDDWRRNGKAVRYELAEAAWRETVAYITGRERERWEAALEKAFVALDDVEYGLTGIESEMNEHQFSDAAQLLSVTQQDLGEALNELSPVRALLQPEQGGQ